MKKVGRPKGSKNSPKQFCIHGHDTFIIGRDKYGNCCDCRTLGRRKMIVFKKDNQFCPKGHDKDIMCRTTKGYCQKCASDAGNQWRKSNPLKTKANSLKQRHNITSKDRDKILNDQKGKCAICERFEVDLKSPLHVDHDHSCCPGEKSCGKCIRGLLCYDCNRGLGAFKDSDLLLKNAQEYLLIRKIR